MKHQEALLASSRYSIADLLRLPCLAPAFSSIHPAKRFLKKVGELFGVADEVVLTSIAALSDTVWLARSNQR